MSESQETQTALQSAAETYDAATAALVAFTGGRSTAEFAALWSAWLDALRALTAAARHAAPASDPMTAQTEEA